MMSLDAVRRIADHLPTEKVPKLDLILHTDGGDTVVPWRLMTLLREYAEEVDVLVAHRAFSAGTLTALGADQIVMHPLAMLGPIDPTVHDPFGPRDEETGNRPGVSVEDVSAYMKLVQEDIGLSEPAEMLEVFKLLAGEVHPLTLGHVKRGTQQAAMLGRKLLQLPANKMNDEQIKTALSELTTKLYFHGHPIHRGEAKSLGLPVEYPEKSVEDALWSLYLLFESDLDLERPFDTVGTAMEAGGTVPNSGFSTVRIPPMPRVMVESASRSDTFFNEFEISLSRTDDGGVAATVVSRGSHWDADLSESSGESPPTDA